MTTSVVVRGVIDQIQQTLDELRQLSHGVAPSALVGRGLATTTTEVAIRSAVPVTVSTELSQDPSGYVSQAIYFMVSESLTNLSKHPGATIAGVEVRVVGDSLQVRTNDNGIDGVSTARSHGLAGLIECLNGVDSRLVLTSPAGRPATVEAMTPYTF